MTEAVWHNGSVPRLGVQLAGDRIGDLDERGEPIVGDTMLLLLNAHDAVVPFGLPAPPEGQLWERLLDTTEPQGKPLQCRGGQPYQLHGRALAVLRAAGAARRPVTGEGERPAGTRGAAAARRGPR